MKGSNGAVLLINSANQLLVLYPASKVDDGKEEKETPMVP